MEMASWRAIERQQQCTVCVEWDVGLHWWRVVYVFLRAGLIEACGWLNYSWLILKVCSIINVGLLHGDVVNLLTCNWNEW